MDKNCTFNPLEPTKENNQPITTQKFDPMGCVGGITSANQSLLSCDQTIGARTLLEGLAVEANNLYGLNILYYRQNFEPIKAHPIYGDQNTEFLGPYIVKAYVSVNSDSSIFTQLGIENTNDLDLQISYEAWADAFGQITPQAGDKFEIEGLLCNRPSGFTRAIFKVVSQGDSDLFEASRRWFISAQRSTFSWLPNEPKEEIDNQVTSDAIIGEIDSDNMPVVGNSQENALGRDIDDVSSENLRNENDEVYGGYYRDGIYFDPNDL